ncbi:MAG: hypothetical protein BWK77_00430 [Verrucomicrobia bacterium A1]|nr:MAG: hypothetical protein BWK77_00430 [Verrucomicrobia bacterium A1]
MPYFVAVLLYLAFSGFLALTAPELPDRVATHFGMEGAANDWMNRPSYLAFVAAFPLLLGVLFAGISASCCG